MYGRALTTDEIKQRINRGRNYERLYRQLKPRYKQAMDRIAELEALLAKQAEAIEAQAARIEQLETMVFGRKTRLPRQPKLRLVSKRDEAAYRRPIPPATSITATETFTVNACQRCGHALTDKTKVIRYQEDIVLAVLNPALPTRRVTKQVIERGWCSRCGQYSAGKDLRGQTVALGPVVRTYLVYLICHLDLSYAQAQELLWQQHSLYVASSEISAILDERRLDYLPLYEQLKEHIRAGPVHMDETSYPIQAEQGTGWAWTMTGSNSPDVVYHLAESRSKAQVEALLGPDFGQVGITDRYKAYKYVFVPGKHQICWAHLARNARDIAALECLDEQAKPLARAFYREFNQVYSTVRKIWAEPYEQTKRAEQAKHLLPEVQRLCQPTKQDPKQLTDLKAGILEYRDCLFICLTEPNTPPDNNKAERSLRKLVIKRKKSLGVRTAKGARTMEVLQSVVQSLANRDRDNLFRNLHRLAVA